MSEISCELSSREELPRILRLHQENFPHLGWSEAFIDWQYLENPAGDACVWVARNGGSVVATYAAIPHRISYKGRVGIGWRAQDVVTSPEFRKRGLYHKLSRLACDFLFDEKYPLNFSFPNENSHDGFIRNGWRDLFRVPLREMTGAAGETFEPDGAIVTPISSFDESTESVWEKNVRGVEFAIVRDAAYLNWRYFSNPKSDFFPFRISMGNDEIVIVLKYYDREDGSRWAHICDLFGATQNRSLLSATVRHGIMFAGNKGCGNISCWCPSGNNLEAVLNDHRFLLRHDITRWLIGNMNSSKEDFSEVSDESRWHLSMGDSDVY